MTSSTPTRRLRGLVAGLAAAAVLALGACSGDDNGATTAPTTSAPVSSQPASSGGETTSAPASTETSPAETSPAETPPAESSPAETSPASNGKQTDASLAKIMTGVKVNGKPVKVIPAQTVRAGGTAQAPKVEPAECQFAAEGLLGVIAAGNPAALALLEEAGGGASIVDMGSEDAAKKVLADRDGVLDNPKCKSVKTTQQGQTSEVKIAEQKTDGLGLSDARIAVTSSEAGGQKLEQHGLMSRKGSVLVSVNVPAGQDAVMKEVVEQLLAAL